MDLKKEDSERVVTIVPVFEYENCSHDDNTDFYSTCCGLAASLRKALIPIRMPLTFGDKKHLEQWKEMAESSSGVIVYVRLLTGSRLRTSVDYDYEYKLCDMRTGESHNGMSEQDLIGRLQDTFCDDIVGAILETVNKLWQEHRYKIMGMVEMVERPNFMVQFVDGIGYHVGDGTITNTYVGKLEKMIIGVHAFCHVTKFRRMNGDMSKQGLANVSPGFGSLSSLLDYWNKLASGKFEVPEYKKKVEVLDCKKEAEFVMGTLRGAVSGIEDLLKPFDNWVKVAILERVIADIKIGRTAKKEEVFALPLVPDYDKNIEFDYPYMDKER